MADYVVTAACVVAKDSSPSGESYYYRDAVLPAGVSVAEKKRLADAGLVKAVSAAARQKPADDSSSGD